MLKDLPQNKVEDIAIAIANEQNEQQAEIWRVYLINMKDTDLENVLVSSKGYGMHNGREVTTSVLRHGLRTVPAGGVVPIEIIDNQVFGLNNEYFLTFYIGNNIFDKKYIFLPETISKDNLVHLPIHGGMGIMII